MINNRKEVVNLLNLLEVKYNTSRWQFLAIDLWPILKKTLFFLYHHQSHGGLDKHLETSKSRRLQSRVKQLITLIRYYIRKALFDKGINTDILFSGAESHEISSQSTIYNRYFISIYMKYANKKKAYLDYTYSDKLKTNFFFNKLKKIHVYDELIKPLALLRRFYSIRSKKTFVHKTQLYSLIHEFVSTIGIEKSGEAVAKSFLQEIWLISMLSLDLEKRLRAHLPKRIFMLCYYDLFNYALSKAAHNLNIPTYDIQHGAQGPLHISYSSFNLEKQEYYNCLPSFFWCWDKDSYMNIKKWTDKTLHHKSLNFGNPWLFYAKEHLNTPFKSFKNIILITLQDTIYEDYVFKAIQKSEDYIWFIRLHPRYKHLEGDLTKIIENYGIDEKVNIHDATELPLPQILINSILHISEYSGSIIESCMLQTPTLIISEIGRQTFKNLINDNQADLCLTNDSEVFLDKVYSIIK